MGKRLKQAHHKREYPNAKSKIKNKDRYSTPLVIREVQI